jgi:hypothetical protein
LNLSQPIGHLPEKLACAQAQFLIKNVRQVPPMKSSRGLLTGGFCVLVFLTISGCGGSSAPAAPPPPPPDATAPTVSTVSAPAGPVDRTVTLSVTANDNVSVTEVRFFVDGNLLGNDTTTPFTIDWDTSGEAEGDHTLAAEAEDAAGNVTRSADITVTVRNIRPFAIALSGEQEVPASGSQATAQADLTFNLVTGEVMGELIINGLAATAAHIHDAFAGANGDILIGLDPDPMDANRFTVPAGAMLDQAGVDRLLAAALYVNVHTAAVPAGEIRGQLLPEGFVLRFTELGGSQQVPRLFTFARGRAAITLDGTSGTLVVQAQVEELDDATQAHVHEAYAGANGPVLVALNQDPMDVTRWFVEDGVLDAAGLAAFAAGRLYVNVHSPANQPGEIRGQIIPDGIDLLFAELSGDQAVPAIESRASGLAAVTLDQAGSLVTIHANTERLDDATLAHLHGEYAGANGGVEVGLNQDAADPSHWFAEEQILDAAQLDALLGGATYVNVHSPAHPGGEIRGQVIPDGVLLALGPLAGNQRVPPVVTAAGGTFAVTADLNASTLVAHANTSGVDDATAAHVHIGFAGTNGGVAIGLAQDPMDVTRWSVVNAPLDVGRITALRDGRYYINVHTPANPDGEIRGQIALDPVEVLFTQMSGEQQVPAIASAATGIAASTIDRQTGDVTLHLNAIGADDATASHIHSGYAGQNGGVLIGLQQDAADAGHWSVSGTQLDAAGLADYLGGRLYVNLHTPANLPGEIRGQIAPREVQVVFSPMSGDQVVPPVVTAAGGLAATTADISARSLVAFINASGVDDAVSAGIHVAAAGQNGPEMLPLAQTPMQPGQWSGMAGRLDAATFAAYRSGGTYAQVATPANPDGELRGQITPPDAANFDVIAPTVDLASPGADVSGTVTLNADAADDQAVVEVRFLADGVLIGSDTTAPYSIDWDTTTAANGQVTLTAEAEDEAGNVGVSGDVVVNVQNAQPVTLTQLQNQIFTPICSVCHSGPTSNVLPSGMDLTAGNSHASLVNVASLEVALDRVEPGDPDNSYLIHKLEGTQAFGDRMPQGGPFLDPPTIDMVRQWIADGAPDN